MASRQKLQILCVDDEPSIVEALCAVLADEYDAQSATSPAQALQKVNELERLAVVVSDMRMPGMDGASFLHEVMLRRPDVTLEKEDQVGLVRKALAHLSPTLRGAVALRDVHDLSYEEIAARLQLPEGTVKSRINRGRKELGKYLRALQEPATVNRGGRADRHTKGQEA